MKKRLLTAWLIACMMISLVGQTPITALAEGDDSRVIPVSEGLQEVLLNNASETPEIQDETTVVENPEIQTEEDAIVEDQNTEITQDESTIEEAPATLVEQDENTIADDTTVKSEDTTVETPDVQNVQDEIAEETPDVQTVQNENSEAQIAQDENTVVDETVVVPTEEVANDTQNTQEVEETIELVEKIVDADLPQGTLNLGDIVRVSGLLPKDAIVEAIPVNVEIEGQSVLLAYDITIYENEEKKNVGISWQPNENGLSVEFISSALETVEEEVNIWHMSDVSETPKYVTAAPSPEDSVEFVAESFSVYVVTSTKLTATIVASDGNTYEINVTYTNLSGIPMDGTKLAVSELKSGDEGYDEYIEESASKVGTKAEDFEFSKVFDIKIVDENDESIEYEPTGDVDVSIRVIGVSLSEYPQVNVLHFVEDRNEENFLVYDVDSNVNGETVEFTTDSFSVYVIVGHEGGDIETPRMTIHFLAPVTDTATQETLDPVSGTYSYTVGAFSFLNKANEWQTSQIVQNNETLERISNPPNLTNKFFYGWYVVNVTSKGENSYNFRWTASPKHLPFEQNIGVVDNGDGTFTMSWTENGELFTETAEVDPTDYSAHVYVAPIYQDYCFVNFHELAYAVSSNSNLLTRKLVILGDDQTETVLISDITAQATDTIRRIFRGWQYRTNDTWISVQTMDNSANTIRKTIEVTDDIDLYPYFQEGRWLYFNVGDSGNGAKYVPAQFTLAEFNSQDGGASVGGTVTNLPTTNRVGYDFGGWRVIVNGDTDNPIYALITDENGDIKSTFTYTDKDGNETNNIPSGCTSTSISISESYVDNDYNVLTGEAFTVENGVITIKYPLSSLTFYAKWTEKADSKVTIVIWKQKVTDAANLSNDQKDYDYYVLDALPNTVNAHSGITVDQLNLNSYKALTTNNSTRSDFVGFHIRSTDPVVMNTPTVKGDGSSVVNVYYDRNVHTLTFRANNTTVKTITELYEHNISSYFPIQGTNGTTYNQGQRWNPQNSSTFNQVLVYIDIMPDEDITFTLNTSTNSEKNLYYYVEPLLSADATRTYNGKGFELYHHTVARYGFFTENEDYLDLVGFSKSASYPPQAFNQNGTQVSSVWNNTNAFSIYCYYLRNSYKLTFDYNYPAATGMSAKYVTKEGVLYESSLSKYDHNQHKDDFVDAIWPSETEIPDHYEFGGWFEDAACTKEFNFNITMPAADKIAYGKWTPVYYNILIDPNGGVIDHINYDESTDGGYPTFSLAGFSTADSNDAKWQAAWDANGDAYGTMPSWAITLGGLGSGHNTSQSTYFSALYGTAIGEYDLERTYVEYDGTDDGTKLYYVNMQFNSTSGEWGLHSDLRNALYLTSVQLEAYYNYCKAAQAWHEVSRPGYYDGTIPSSFEEFKNLYVKKNGNGDYTLYESVPSGSYAFVGWYVVDSNGNISDTPYSFANAVEGSIALKAIWRRVGSYYISYDPAYELEYNGSTYLINGVIQAWTDPADTTSENYNDGATTTTLQQPTGITVNGQDAGDAYIFRGWQVVKLVKDGNGNVVQRIPLHDGVYYPEPTIFVIDAADADANGCIHMQAVYQPVNVSDLRPEVANLMLNANDGFITTNGGSSRLASDEDITVESGWGVGTVIEDESENEVVFGDMQSNDAVHLYKYAIRQGALESPYNNSGLYFKHLNNYLLIGFDEKSDYTHKMTLGDDSDNTSSPYVPQYASDAVISVQRTDSTKLYAVWEPMVYVTFKNRTSQPVTFTLSGDDAMKVVNEVTGLFSREQFTETTITLAAGESIKLVMPEGAGKNITINGTNTNTAQLLTVKSYHKAEVTGQETGQTTAGVYRSNGADYNLKETLIDDEVGVLVFFDGTDTVFYDVNGGNWTDASRTGSDRDTVLNDNSLLFVDEDGMPYAPVTLPSKAPKPTDPERTGYKFEGWTADYDAAHCDLSEYTLPGTDSTANINNLAVIKNSLLWDFTEQATEGMTLYAVWGEEVTVTFHITSSHIWQETDNTYFVPGNNRKYVVTLSKGDIVNTPNSPSWPAHSFYRWLKVSTYESGNTNVSNLVSTDIFNFGIPVENDVDLYTSWIEADYINVDISKIVISAIPEDKDKYYTFDAEITTTTYTRTVRRSGGNGRTWTEGTLNQKETTEHQTFTLKDSEKYLLPLYFHANESRRINSNTTVTFTVFYQSIIITEKSDPNFKVTITVDNNPSSEGSVSTMSSATPTLTYNANSNTDRTYTFSGNATYTITDPVTKVPVVFTNTRDKTDVKVTKIVTPDDYITGDEAFNFTATYKDNSNQTVTPPTLTGYDAYGYTVSGDTASFALKDGQEFILRGIPIGGSVTVTETATGWTATSVNDADSTDTDGATFTLSNVLSTGGGITFTNVRDTYDVTVKNTVEPSPYGDKTKPFTYTATLWDGDTQVAFPSSITDVTFTNGRKNMTFTLKHEQEYVIRNLPGGYKLVVTQAVDPDYDVTSTGKKISDDSVIADGDTSNDNIFIISAIGVNAQIDFVNTLKKGSYTITKHVQLDNGQTITDGTEFFFTARLLKTAGSQNYEAISSELEAALPAGASAVDTNGDAIKDEIRFSFKQDISNNIDLTSIDGDEITFTGLPVGHFLQVTEVAPGYAAYINNIRTDSTTVQIAEDDNGKINYINRPASSSLKIQKTDALDSSPIKGAKFRLYSIQGGTQNTLFTLTSDDNGWLTYTESGNTNDVLSLENGTYYLVETDAPNGYKKSEEVFTIKVNNSEADAQDRIKLILGNAGTLTYTSESDPFILTVTNERTNVAPTNYSNKFLPFALIFMFSLLLSSTPIIAILKRREEG